MKTIKFLLGLFAVVVLQSGCVAPGSYIPDNHPQSRYNRNRPYDWNHNQQSRYFFAPDDPGVAAEKFAGSAEKALGAINGINACPKGYAPANTQIQSSADAHLSDNQGRIDYQYRAEGYRSNQCVPASGSVK